MKFRAITIAVLLLAIASGCFSLVSAQAITGRISGTIYDANGAIVAGASVKIVNEATQESRTATSDSNGNYVVTNLLPTSYSVMVEQQGFKKSTRTGNVLVADGRLTVDFKLETGAVTESVEVMAAVGETVNTTSGEVARVIDGSQVQDLALNGRNYMQLTTLIPGSPLINDNQLDLMTSLSVSQPINGQRGNANSLTVDGGFNLDSGSNGSQINNVGLNFIKEVNIKTSNFSAEYGRMSGAAINVVTQNGGNKYHGSAWEFFRNEKLDANNFYINRTPLSTAQRTAGLTEQPRPPLRYNNFGWSLGGPMPIKKDKFFFFAGMEWKLIRRSTDATLRTLPTRLERTGDFSVRLRGTDGIVGTADDGVLRDPLSTLPCTAATPTVAAVRDGCFPGNKILPNRLTTDGKAIAKVYDVMETLAFFYNDTTAANNATYVRPNPFEVRQEFIRLDYRFNDRHSIYGRFLHDDYVLTAPYGTFIDSQLPTIPTERRRPGFSYQVSYTWMISPTLINEAKANTAWNGQRIPPVGENWKRSTYGFVYPQLFPFGRYEEGIANIDIAGFSSFRGPNASLLSPTTDIALADNLTWVKRSHTLKAGVLVIRNRKDQNGRPVYTGAIGFQNTANPNTTNQPFADALLGNFFNYNETEDDPVGFFRFSSVEGYGLDAWKINRKLSIEFGVRYQWVQPTYTQQNNMASFNPALYDPSKAVTLLNNGLIDTTKGGSRFNGLWRSGGGVPEDQLGRVPLGNSARVLGVPSTAPRGLYESQHLFAPRFSFAYAPFNDNKTAIRGGFGMFYEKPEGNIVFSLVNVPPFLDSAQYQNGNLSNIRGGTAAALAPFGPIESIDPNMVLPRSYNYSLTIQRELQNGIFLEVGYVGNQGRHLIRRPDINVPSFADQAANAALPTAQRKNFNALRPYKGFSTINTYLSDANSRYNALQIYVTKRKGQSTFNLGYTWSKVLTDTPGGGIGSGVDTGEDPGNRSANYGPADYDRRHIFVASYVYRVPFFSKSNAILRNALGGWEASGITRWQTGQYLTVTSNSSIGTRRADYIGGEIKNDGNYEPDASRWFNTTAFAQVPDTRRGTSGVGMVLGPGRFLTDLSLRKKFSITERFKLQFQGDLFNAFNQVMWNNPNVSFNNNAFGQISGAAPGRNVQLGLQLTF
ncbi:MAG: carboxypeptidase regulatory-like domain-containing protein [Acidobacteria bacterium]|nr:carboxypeptidase regulatory-like domain-containing protein [Acidobacteriota bacterium]